MDYLGDSVYEPYILMGETTPSLRVDCNGMDAHHCQ
jgi:hypothetical protein